jgi:cytochrome P450
MAQSDVRALYDPADPSFGARSHDIFRKMRDEQPVYADPHGRFFALSRFEDVRSATLDWQTFSSKGKLEARYIKPTMSSLDPPEHGELRNIVSRAFTPRRVSELEDDIRALARSLIDEFAEDGSCDAIAQFATLLPSMVIGRLIGIPDELVPVCRELTDDNMRKTSPAGAAEPAARSYEIFAELYAERRSQPSDDLLSALLAAEVSGRSLTDDELLAFGWLMLVGGNDTTTNLIGNGIELLARHPEQRAELAADPSLLPAAIEEILRVASPTHTLARHTSRDAVLANGTIPAGSRVLLLWAAANLDEREFEDPERFDIHRHAPRHLAFGHGVHFCLGAALARLEARLALEEWLRRIPHYEVVGTPQHIVSSTFHGFETLPIVFSRSSGRG